MNSIGDQYHSWYYNQEVWNHTTFLGVHCLKSVSDMWNYQEILHELKPKLLVEFGSFVGGSALYFAEILKLVSPSSRVLSVDIDQQHIPAFVRQNERIEFLEQDTTSPTVAAKIRSLRALYPGPSFFILDSDHRKPHVFNELMQIRSLTQTDDYVIVEDSNINGHPVLPHWGPGPYEALEEYLALYPDDYIADVKREQKFGFTFAPNGFLVRR